MKEEEKKGKYGGSRRRRRLQIARLRFVTELVVRPAPTMLADAAQAGNHASKSESSRNSSLTSYHPYSTYLLLYSMPPETLSSRGC